jgi:acetamidase/formamidase
MIDLLAEHWGFSELHAYLLCSVAMDLRLAQVVNRPMITVAASISKDILPRTKAVLTRETDKRDDQRSSDTC